jgi:hypothetical protein
MAQVHRRRIVALVTSILAVGILAPPAHAEVPTNDRFRNAIEIPAIPFTTTQDTTEALSDGPRYCSNNGSVFYAFTPTETRRLQADTIGSDYDTVLGVSTGGRDDAVEIACNDDRFGLQSAVRFKAEAGVTYTLMIGFCCGNGRDFQDGGNLVLNLDRARKDADLQVDHQIDLDAVLGADGSATVSGTADCTARSQMGIFGKLKQPQGDVRVRGEVRVSFLCDPSSTSEWEVTVVARGGASFVPGEAKLLYSFAADSWNQSFFFQNRSATVQLAEA